MRTNPSTITHVMPRPFFVARSSCLAVAVVGVLSGCSSGDDAAARRDSIVAASEEAYAASHKASAPPDTVDSTVRAPAALTDNNILARLAQGDRMEVQAARIAIGKAASADLRAFARQLADNHSASENDARTMAQRLKIQEQPAATDSTKAHQQALVTRLNSTPKGTAFDTTYVRHLIDSHAATLADAKAMEPKAKSPEVKKLVQAAIPELERHLSRARAIGKALTAPKTK
jgi:putative membrane protein